MGRLGSRALLEEVCHWAQALRFHSLPSLPYFLLAALTLACFRCVEAWSSLLPGCFCLSCLPTMMDCNPSGAVSYTKSKPFSHLSRFWSWHFVRATKKKGVLLSGAYFPTLSSGQSSKSRLTTSCSKPFCGSPLPVPVPLLKSHSYSPRPVSRLSSVFFASVVFSCDSLLFFVLNWFLSPPPPSPMYLWDTFHLKFIH